MFERALTSTSALALALLVSVPSIAAPNPSSAEQAPPDPFADFESRPADDKDKDAGAASTPAPTADAPDEVIVEAVPALRIGRGLWNVGVRTGLSWTTASSDQPDGTTAKNTNLFARVSPMVGYMITDGLELSGSIGFLTQSLARGETAIATENDWLLEAMLSYSAPLSKRLALTPAIGLGGYLGSSTRSVAVVREGQPTTVDEGTSTMGALAEAALLLTYQATARVQVRAGLAFTALLGNEETSDASLGVQTFNTGLTIGLAYGL